MKIKTSELKGEALDWAVWICEFSDVTDEDELLRALSVFTPSTNWEQGGAIIDKFGICLVRRKVIKTYGWFASLAVPSNHEMFGETSLIAAMRCYVFNKLGSTVDVPDTFLSPLEA